MNTLDLIHDQIHLDQDAISAYDEAIAGCDSASIQVKLGAFRADHERHVRELSALSRQLGGSPPEGKDVKGFFIQGFTKLMSRGDRSALMAMRGNEELTNRSYAKALEHDLPHELRAIFEANLEDERRHLAWIKEELAMMDQDEPRPEPPAPIP